MSEREFFERLVALRDRERLINANPERWPADRGVCVPFTFDLSELDPLGLAAPELEEVSR